MHCAKASRLLQLYLDGYLSSEQLRALELHLSGCSTCQQELFVLQRIEQSLRDFGTVVEPPDLTVNIMRRVAATPQMESPRFILLRPSLTEIAVAIGLATITTMGVILGQPSLRASLPFANGHDMLSFLFLDVMRALTMMNSQTLMLALWVVGTLLGIWITFALAGNEMRRMEWFRSVKDRLSV
jgi:predicted anti-sigma-YlaC factor YlaD